MVGLLDSDFCFLRRRLIEEFLPGRECPYLQFMADRMAGNREESDVSAGGIDRRDEVVSGRRAEVSGRGEVDQGDRLHHYFTIGRRPLHALWV